jgi:hypothetical protein
MATVDLKLTSFENEVLASILWQIKGLTDGKVTERVTKRILRATLRRIEPRKIGTSENGLLASKVESDHAVPLSVIVDKIINQNEMDEKILFSLLSKYLVSVNITNEEHMRLKDLGLQSSMPNGWDHSDPYARYAAAQIKLESR